MHFVDIVRRVTHIELKSIKSTRANATSSARHRPPLHSASYSLLTRSATGVRTRHIHTTAQNHMYSICSFFVSARLTSDASLFLRDSRVTSLHRRPTGQKTTSIRDFLQFDLHARTLPLTTYAGRAPACAAGDMPDAGRRVCSVFATVPCNNKGGSRSPS